MKKLASFIILSIFMASIVNVTAQTVYITKTGTKYHNDGCRYLSKSKTAIDLSTAISKGYLPCSVCKPPTQAGSQVNSKTTSPKTDVKQQEKVSTDQPNAKATPETTPSGKTLITGPKGGTYYIDKNGKKVYVKK